MRLVAFALVAALAAAGCMAPEPVPAPPPPPGPPEPSTPVFASPVAIGNGGEPGLLLAYGPQVNASVGPANANPTLWAHAPGALWRSDDNGTTWDAVAPGTALTVFGNDAEMVQDSKGRLYYSDLQLTASLAVYVSADDGRSWSYNPVASVVPSVDRQWMATAPDAGPLAGSEPAVYLAFNQLQTSPWVMKSVDGGTTWTGRLVDPTQDQARFWSIGNIIANPWTGELFLSWVVGYAGEGLTPNPPTGYAIRVARSADGGTTWTTTEAFRSEERPGHLFAVLAQDTAGTLYMAWSQAKGDHQEILLSHSKDKGARWTEPLRVDADGTAVQPWIEAAGPGEVALVWYGSNTTALSDSATDAAWHVRMARSWDATHVTPTFERTTVTPEPVRVGPICTVGIACDGNRDLLDFFQVKLDRQGYAHVIYADTESGSGTTAFYARQVGGPTL